jgi:hypothetical protein
MNFSCFRPVGFCADVERNFGRLAAFCGRPNKMAWERVRCSSLVDWPVFPRLGDTMQASTR